MEKIVKEGKFENTKPIGYWQYNIISDSSTIETSIIWEEEKNKNCSINYSSNWELIETGDSTKLFIFDLKPELDRKVIDNHFFIVLRHNQNKTVESYNEYYNRVIHNENKVEWFDKYKLTIDGKIIGYFNRYQVMTKGIDILILNYNLQKDNIVYDVTMKIDNDDDKSLSQLIFFETLRSFHINEELAIPHEGFLKIE